MKNSRLRLSVYRSNKEIYAQIIDDEKGQTLAAFDTSKIKSAKIKMTKIEKAREVGKSIAEKALSLKIKKVVYDRGDFRYHGRIKALAEGAREGGLEF